MIQIDLAAPARVDGALASPQSLWLLLRMWLAATREHDASGGWVRAVELRQQFSAARNPRMLISRAFAHFARWGIVVGWGTDRTRPLQLLSVAGRNRGPFWLAPGQVEQLEIVIGSRPASLDEIRLWLAQSDTTEPAQISDRSTSLIAASAVYWHAWGAAKHDTLTGRLIVAGNQGALAGYRRAQALASDPYLSAMALLQQAMVWRRAGNADAALSVLAQLDQHSHDVQAPEYAWIGAMAEIVAAWCAYARRDWVVARQKLSTACANPRWAAAFRYHPRVRVEHANLLALIQRAVALNESLLSAERENAANDAVASYQLALTLANETELFDAAAAAASNLGWSLWLFARARLRLQSPPQTPALQWIALAAWLHEQHHVGGGSWNTIYLLRMVREAGPDQIHPELAPFQRWPVLSPVQFRAVVAPIELSAQWDNWRTRLALELAAVDAGRLQIDALQLSNLLLEQAWYAAHDGDLTSAVIAADRLRRRLRELTPADRGFFRDALRRLPLRVKDR